ncbi:MAG: NifU family protein [Pseudomonadota bacterium]|nr:NifU family protein [Pseudomonadota bacterium]MDE3037679.1 NifU family protein [Pseudomonadota bacterium]
MFVQSETTPNPLTLKFIPGVPVLGNGTAFFTSAEAAAPSPLAESLFKISGITAIFLGLDFITVTKEEDIAWDSLKPLIFNCIMDHFVAGKPVMREAHTVAPSGENESEIVKHIRELIDTRVRPAVAQDGGDIIFRGFHDGIVELELHGSCSGCPSSTMTLKNGIENMLKHYVPEVIAVEAVA